MKIALINGPNLDRLGTREPEVYGKETLKDIVSQVETAVQAAGHSLWAFQSNSEAELIDAVGKAAEDCAAIIINPAAYSHTSIALRDALAACAIPIVEVHLSNIYKREAFRQHSYVSAVSEGVISGFGSQGYLLALEAVKRILAK